MSVLIVDLRAFHEGAEDPNSRGVTLRNTLVDVDAEMRLVPQVWGQAFDVHTWDMARPNALSLASGVSCILLHVGEKQPLICDFLAEVCASIPVLAYTGGTPQDCVEPLIKQCETSALFPELIGIPTPGQLAKITGWVEAVTTAQGNKDAIRKACHILRRFDEGLEEQLLTLREGWVQGVDIAELQKTRDSYPKLGVSC